MRAKIFFFEEIFPPVPASVFLPLPPYKLHPQLTEIKQYNKLIIIIKVTMKRIKLENQTLKTSILFENEIIET